MRGQNQTRTERLEMVAPQRQRRRSARVQVGSRRAGPLVVLLCASLFSPGMSQAAARSSLLLFEDFEAGLSARWEEQGFPSIDRTNVFSLASEPNGNHYLKVESDRSS